MPVNEPLTSDHHSVNSHTWHLCGRRFPKSEVVYACQVIVIYAVISVSLVNLTLYKDEGKLWTALLSSCLGYMLPNPSIKSYPSEERQ